MSSYTLHAAGRSDFARRLWVAIPGIAALLLVNAAGGLVWTLILCAFGCLCFYEFRALTATAWIYFWAGGIAVTGLLFAALYDPKLMVLAVAGTLPLLFLAAVRQPGGKALPQMAITLLGVCWIGLALAHAVLLRQLPHGDGLVIDVLAATFAGDTGAYLGGRVIGRHKLAPRVSPGKTIEGLVCGVVTAIGAIYIASLFQSWITLPQVFIVGAVIALVAPIGDLFESFLKRDLGVKDSGKAFGAHGGALDRADAALFAVVAGYYLWQVMG